MAVISIKPPIAEIIAAIEMTNKVLRLLLGLVSSSPDTAVAVLLGVLLVLGEAV